MDVFQVQLQNSAFLEEKLSNLAVSIPTTDTHLLSVSLVLSLNCLFTFKMYSVYFLLSQN